MNNTSTEVLVPDLWAGTDAGKAHHHCVVIDADGTKRLSRRVANDETELLELINDVLELSEDVTWAIDLNAGGAALAMSRAGRHFRSSNGQGACHDLCHAHTDHIGRVDRHPPGSC